jgi:hypothetical protein
MFYRRKCHELISSRMNLFTSIYICKMLIVFILFNQVDITVCELNKETFLFQSQRSTHSEFVIGKQISNSVGKPAYFRG